MLGTVLGEDNLLDAAWLLLTPPAESGLILRPAPQSSVLGTLTTVLGDSPVASHTIALDAMLRLEAGPATVAAITLRDCEALLANPSLTSALTAECQRVLSPGGTIYLDAVLAPSLLIRLRIAMRLAGLIRNVCVGGRRVQQVLHLREADGAVYRLDPANWRLLARLAMRGGRIAISVGSSDDRLIDRILRSSGYEGISARISTLYFGSGRVFRVETGQHVLRLPRGRAAHDRCQNAFQALIRMTQCSLSFSVPRPVRSILVEYQPVFMESRVQGHGYDYQKLGMEELRHIRARAFAMLEELHGQTMEPAVLAQPDFASLFEVPIDGLLGAPFSPATHTALQAFLDLARQSFLGAEWQFVLGHGDFKIANLISDAGKLACGIVDWDRTTLRGLPGSDIVHYAAFDRALHSQEPFAVAIVRTIALAADIPEVVAYRSRFRLDDQRWAVAGVMTLAQYISSQLSGDRLRDSSWMSLHGDTLREACQLVDDASHRHPQPASVP